MISPVMNTGYGNSMVNPYSTNPISGYAPYSMNPIAAVTYNGKGEEKSGVVKNPSESDVKAPGRKSSPAECETCKNRKYQDGSNENVSFKSAQHVSPQAAAGAVRAHEQEHVSNAYSKAAKNNGKVISANVAIHTAICPECGRSYVSGGTTTTQIKYYNEDNPYQKMLKEADAAKYKGRMVDVAC